MDFETWQGIATIASPIITIIAIFIGGRYFYYKNTKNIQQTHNGNGDNVGGNKIIK